MPGGRPTDYLPEYAEQAEKLCKLGATDADLADFFEVSITTIWRWSGRHEEFCKAIKTGKELADDRVERSLYHRAVGYTHDAVKIFQHQGQVVEAPYREHVPPDTAAAFIWLKNRRKDQWRDRIAHEHGGPDGGPIKVEGNEVDLARRVAFLLSAGEARLKASEE